jgi:hypothetical protein
VGVESGRAPEDASFPNTASIVTAAVVFCLVLFLPPLLNDGDTLWQIRAGEWILDHRAIPHTDPFSYTAAGHRWFAHEWLAEVLLALAYRAARWRGVLALAALASALTFGLLARHLRRFMPTLPAVLLVIVAAALLAPSWLARPHLLALPCMEVWCAGLVLARARGQAPSLALLPVMTLWANLHGSFMAGLLLPFAFLLEAALAGERPVPWIGFVIGAWAAALITPDTLAGLVFPFRMLAMQSTAHIGEWQPVSFAKLHPLEVVIVAALWFGLSGRVRLSRLRLLLFLGLIAAALKHSRNGQLLGIIGPLVLAEPIGAVLPPQLSSVRRVRWVLPTVLGAVALALALRIALPLGRNQDSEALSALHRVPPSLRAQPVLNDYAYGGLLIFEGVRPFVDSRADLYGDVFLARYGEIIWPKPDALEAALAQYRIAWTFFKADNRVVGLLDREPGWQRLYADRFVVVHARTGAAGTSSAQ